MLGRLVYLGQEPASAGDTSMLQIGKNGRYDWVVTGHSLEKILQVCPELVVGKYVAVTSFDSGPLGLNPEDIIAGWKSRNDIAYSPQLSAFGCIPRDQYESGMSSIARQILEAWFQDRNVFESARKQTSFNFVNFVGFAFHDPNADDLTDLFWRQLDWIRPESYVADGNRLKPRKQEHRSLCTHCAGVTFAKAQLRLAGCRPYGTWSF